MPAPPNNKKRGAFAKTELGGIGVASRLDAGGVPLGVQLTNTKHVVIIA